jgi:spermidine/putrescine transport system permease protein
MRKTRQQLEKKNMQLIAKQKAILSKAKRMFLLLFTIFIYIFMYGPLMTMILMSFNDSKVQGLPIVGLTFGWYRELFGNHELWEALIRSFIVSIGSVIIAVFVGICSAFLLNRYKFPGRQVYKSIIVLPLIMPGVILGIALLTTFEILGLEPSLFTVVIGHSTFIIPLIFYLLLNRLERLDINLEYASLDLGANRAQTFRKLY